MESTCFQTIVALYLCIVPLQAMEKEDMPKKVAKAKKRIDKAPEKATINEYKMVIKYYHQKKNDMNMAMRYKDLFESSPRSADGEKKPKCKCCWD